MSGAIAGKYFDSWAYRYDKFAYDTGWSVPERLVEAVAANLDPAILRSTLDVLDLGIGTGLTSQKLRQALNHTKIQITGIDSSEKMLQECWKKSVANALYQMDIDEPLPFPDKSFPLVVACSAIEYLSFPKNFIVEMIRLARPGGLVAFSYMPSPDRHERVDEYEEGKPIHYYPRRMMQQVLDSAHVETLSHPRRFVGYRFDEGYKVMYTHCVARIPGGVT